MYVQSVTLFLIDLFENLKNMYLEIYQIDLAKFISAFLLAWQGALKKLKVKLDFLTHIDVIEGRKKYKRRNMSFYLSICKKQQQTSNENLC